MRPPLCLYLTIALLGAGCTSTFLSGDRRLHVSGHVLDAQHKPIGYAVVELHGVKKETDENGCFYFGGTNPGMDVSITVSKLGYKPYRAGKEFDFYEVVITLAAENSERPSSAIWHRLYIEELSKFDDCLKN
jgi:hypothetical protein